MRHWKLFSSLSALAALPLVACRGNTIQLGDDSADSADPSQMGTGGFVYGVGGSSSDNPTHEAGVAGSADIPGSGGAGGSAGTAGTGGSGGSAGDWRGDPPPPTPVVCPADLGVAPTGGAVLLTDAGADAATSSGEAVCRCTRRPGGPLSSFCPAGDGTTTTLWLTPAGGRISLGGQQAQKSGVYVQLDVPQGAVTAPLWITLTETTCPPPSAFNDASPLYQFAPTDLVFTRPIDIAIPYGSSRADDPPGTATTPQNIGIYVSSGDAYERVSNSYTNAGFMQGSITHFGFLFAGSPKSAAQAACP